MALGSHRPLPGPASRLYLDMVRAEEGELGPHEGVLGSPGSGGRAPPAWPPLGVPCPEAEGRRPCLASEAPSRSSHLGVQWWASLLAPPRPSVRGPPCPGQGAQTCMSSFQVLCPKLTSGRFV